MGPRRRQLSRRRTARTVSPRQRRAERSLTVRAVAIDEPQNGMAVQNAARDRCSTTTSRSRAAPRAGCRRSRAPARSRCRRSCAVAVGVAARQRVSHARPLRREPRSARPARDRDGSSSSIRRRGASPIRTTRIEPTGVHGLPTRDARRAGRAPAAHVRELGRARVHAHLVAAAAQLARRADGDRVEDGACRDDIRVRMLALLINAETFERFCHTKYPGTKRFSLEGSESLIPVLDLVLSARRAAPARSKRCSAWRTAVGSPRSSR